MAIDAINSTSSSTAALVPRQLTKQLTQDDFFKLLVTQMTAQDPLNPQKDTEFIAQMAQFSALEQARGMEGDIAKMRSGQDLAGANSMLGHQVEVPMPDGTLLQGTVSAVQIADGSPKLIINDQQFNPSDVLRVWQRN
jgi:flagellar basal-body rod modification protein FlgD